MGLERGLKEKIPEIQEVIQSMVSNNNQVNYKKLIDIIPSNKVKNHAYINKGNLKFEREENGLNTPSFSNGAAYADLDNDGDYDLVVNNVNMPLFVYKNNLNSDSNYLKVVLKGEGENRDAIGAKLELKSKEASYFLEQQPVRGFQSSMDNRPNFGFKEKDNLNLTVTWPSGKITQLSNFKVNSIITLEEKDGIFPENTALSVDDSNLFQKENEVLDFVHKENNFVDFNIERLLPFMRSSEGPKTAIGDVNGDGKDDLFIGGSKGNVAKLFIQKQNRFDEFKTTTFDLNKNSEDAESVFFDADGDGDLDLYVCGGGIEFSKFSPNYLDKLYFNDGQGNFTVSNQILPTKTGYHSSSTVCVADIDNDGDLDLFVGERAIPNNYGKPGSGFLLINDGTGTFTENLESLAPIFKNLGMITDALFIDVNNNGYQDLVVVGEFMGIHIFENKKGSFSEAKDSNLLNLKGWWNTIEASDLDNDGDLDLIVGNHGLNSRFRASEKAPIVLYANDFDRNSYIDPILTFTDKNGKQFPYALRHNLVDQLKYLSKKYPDYESFKNAAIDDIFDNEQLDNSIVLEVNNLKEMLLIVCMTAKFIA